MYFNMYGTKILMLNIKKLNKLNIINYKINNIHMSIITYNDVEILCKQLSLNYTISDNEWCFIVLKNNKFINGIFVVSVVSDRYLSLYDDAYLDYCNKNNNIIIENFIKNKKIKLILYPNIYKSNIQNFDLINTLYIQHCKYFTNIVNSKKIENLYIDSLKNNKNIKGINLLKKLNTINETHSIKLNKNIMNQINKLNKYNGITNNNLCMIYYS